MNINQILRKGFENTGDVRFATTWEVPNTSHYLPLHVNTGEAIVYWGDGTSNTYTSADIVSYDSVNHNYASSGMKKIMIEGDDVTWDFNATGTKDRLLTIHFGYQLKFRRFSCRSCNNLELISGKIQPSAYAKSMYLDMADGFSWCPTLKFIPNDFFDDCPNHVILYKAFMQCVGLSGNAPPLWNYYPSGDGCFKDCFSLDNYEDIPNDWKQLP